MLTMLGGLSLPSVQRAESTGFHTPRTGKAKNVVVRSDFGRTPRVNKDAGCDRWIHCDSVLLVGAGAFVVARSLAHPTTKQRRSKTVLSVTRT